MTRACILRCAHACTWSIYIDNAKMRPRGDKARATLNARNEKIPAVRRPSHARRHFRVG